MRVFENVPLSQIVYYKIGGAARFVIHCDKRQDIFEAIRFVQQNNIKKTLVLGLGANILLPDTGFDGAVLLLRGVGNDIHVENEGMINVFSGESMDDLIRFSFSKQLVGLEWAGGLPSSVGGAIRGNAGAFGSEIKDTILSVDAIDLGDPELAVKTYTMQEAAFSYRDSYFKQHPNLIIISGTFRLTKGSEDDMVRAQKVYEENIAYRKKNHPVEYPSCGSVFKNITDPEKVSKILVAWPDVQKLSEEKWHNKVSMGYIINRLGFSGRQVGGAQVSPKHTNYIVNVHQAKAEDVRSLIETIQEKFEQTFGIVPEPEVMLFDSEA